MNKIVKSFGPNALVLDKDGKEVELYVGVVLYDTDTIVGDVVFEEVQETELTALQAAILEGADPTEITPATAAGPQDLVEDQGGSDFVSLQRTAGEVDPNAGYPTGTFYIEEDVSAEEFEPLLVSAFFEEEIDIEWPPYEDDHEESETVEPADDQPEGEGGQTEEAEEGDDETEDQDDSTGQNPGNDKPVGNSPFDGTKGASNDDEGDEGPHSETLEISDVLDTEQDEEEIIPGQNAPRGPQGNNGWGNGDDDAPGNSLGNNNAENNLDGILSPTEQYYDV